MEKIYMDNNQKNQKNKQQSTFQQIFKTQLSKRLSIAMVLVSFFSFLIIGVGNVSYAAPIDEIEDSGLGESFVTNEPSGRALGEGGSAVFPVLMYTTTVNGQTIPIFCLERNIDYMKNTTLTKAEQITDQGLLYVMANTYPHHYFTTDSGTQFPDQVQTWISQVAIWDYLYQTGAENNVGGEDSIANMRATTSIGLDDELSAWSVDGKDVPSTTTFYSKYIEPVVTAAMNATAANGTMTMSIESEDLSLTADEKYYQSALVTVSNTDPDHLQSFNVEITSAPEGTILVDANGKQIENTTGLEQFYVRIPVDNVTEENKVVRLSATGTFRGYDGYYYRAERAQTVSTVFTTDVPNTTGLELPIAYEPAVPDTSMSVAQSVYFIGLVVLLCGIGIIYANTKPKAKQQ